MLLNVVMEIHYCVDIFSLQNRIKWFKVDIVDGRLSYAIEKLYFSPSYVLSNSFLKHVLSGLLSLEYFCIPELEQVLISDFVVEIKIVDPIWLTKKGLKPMCTCQRKRTKAHVHVSEKFLMWNFSVTEKNIY